MIYQYYVHCARRDIMSKNNKKQINNVKKILAPIIRRVGRHSKSQHEELTFIEGTTPYIIDKYCPTPFEIADYYGLKIKYIKITDTDIISYLKREVSTIFISDKYENNKYISKKIVAHELGHFFMDKDPLSALNNDELNKYLPEEIEKEYNANIFAILLMPQIMEGMENSNWQKYSPKILNQRVYKKIIDII